MQFAVIKVNSCDSYPRKAGDTIARVLTTCSIKCNWHEAIPVNLNHCCVVKIFSLTYTLCHFGNN